MIKVRVTLKNLKKRMSPRLIAIFAVLLLVAVAIGAFFVYRTGGPAGLPERVENLLKKTDDGLVRQTKKERQGPLLPTFDVVRVDSTGTAVIAGRGEPGGTITVLANGKPIATVEIDQHGEWAIYVDTPLSEGAQELTLEMRTKSGEIRKSEQVVVIAVPERPGEKPLVVLGETGEASRVLQSPHDSTGLLLSLDIIDYDEDGAVVLSGRSESGAILRAYADNALIGEARADQDGYWTIRPQSAISAGVYSLRIDQIDANGRVLARVEVPFERAEVSDILAAVAKGGGRMVVQPGNSLWRIARRVYGSGFEYTIIYDANQTQIRDPNLIYPGQIFDLPKKIEVDDEIHLLH